jgi:hypothetical protein
MSNNVTFKSGNVMSNQLSNQNANTSQLLFKKNEHQQKNNIEGVQDTLNTYSSLNNDNGIESDNKFRTYMDQARMSTYYQNNPFETLEQSVKNGYTGPQLGGNITSKGKTEEYVNGSATTWN